MAEEKEFFYDIAAPYCLRRSTVLICFQAIKISEIPDVSKIGNKIRYS